MMMTGTEKFDSSAERIEKLRSIVSVSRTGSSILAGLDNEDTIISFGIAKDSAGSYDPDDNRIVLNPIHNDDLLASVLVHEGRHCWQDHQSIHISKTLKPKSLLMVGYAMEADACAMQARFAFEMQDTNPEIMAQLKKGRYEKVAATYGAIVGKVGENEATEAAFKSWYTTTAPDKYGNSYAQYMIKCAQGNSSSLFRREASALNVAEAICQSQDGTRYLKDYAFLENPKNLFLADETKCILDNEVLLWSSRQFTPAHVHQELDQIAIKTKDGKIIAKSENKQINQVLQQARLNGGR